MDKSTLIAQLGQVDVQAAGEIFRGYLRGSVRQMLAAVMAEEVAELTGEKYRPEIDSPFYRAGSVKGQVILEGDRETVQRPRVRQLKNSGTTKEVRLETYAAAQEPSELYESMTRALIAGVSGREMKEVYPDSPSTSKSNVSRHWKKVGAKHVEELRSRDLASHDWLILMLDGIVLSSDQTAIVVIGITTEGRKVVLDFALGNTENYEVCRDLIERIVDHGFRTKQRLPAITDGSKALRKGVREFFTKVIIQRCLVHKERNIRARLSRRDWAELSRLFKRLREVQGKKAGEEVVAEPETFLASRNAKALTSLHEAGNELPAVHNLDVPSTLHKSLLNTNAIENSFRNVRRKIGRVTRFRAETDQASRWLSYALLEAEKGFHRIRGHQHLWRLQAALQRPPAEAEPSATPPVACAPSAIADRPTQATR
jgi:putative transposase